jgi:hypothetical protein
MRIGSEGEPSPAVCEPVTMNVSLLAANVSPQGRIVSANLSP